MPHRRRGYATEAGQALVDYAFRSLNLRRIVATTDFDNEGSIGVMRRLGMTIERNPNPGQPHYLQVVGILENSRTG
jgi:RimJ/RimL family protein N-acetyltransferase